MRTVQEPVQQRSGGQSLPSGSGRHAARAAQMSRLWGIAERPDEQFSALVAPLLAADDDAPLNVDQV